MIYCCGGYHKPLRTVLISPDITFKDRKLEILICPKCGVLVAELTQFNIKTNSYEKYRPKRKKTYEFIKKLEQGVWSEQRIKYGTKERQGFVYGLNRQAADGKIYQYSVDFNGEKKLVKIING